MHPSTKSQIRHIMSDFGETKHHLLHDRVVALAASRWMMPINDNAIIQIELLHHANQALLSSTVARDGSGPLKASFLTMLLLEDTIAHAQRPFGICSGAATVTLHRFIDLDALSTDQLVLALPILPASTMLFLPTICRRQLQNLWPINAIASTTRCDGLEITLNLAAECATRLFNRGISSSQSNRQPKAKNNGPIFAEFRL